MKGNRHVAYVEDPFDDDETEELFLHRNKGMRKMTEFEEKKFPLIVVDSIRCQSFHISRFERCDGCDFAINGCEKVFDMSAN